MLLSSDAPEVTGPKIEALLRKELGWADPIPYTMETEGFRVAAGGVGQLMQALGRREPTDLYTLCFTMAQPRPWEMHAHLIRSRQSYIVVSRLSYIAFLNKPIQAGMWLDEQGVFSGDPQGSAKLNADKKLLKRLIKFARTEMKFGESTLTQPRFVAIEPHTQGTMLAVQTMPVLKWFGMKARLEPVELLAIADAVEAAL